MHKLPLKAVGYLTLTLFAFVALPSSAALLKFTYTNPELLFTTHKVDEVPTVIDGFEAPIVFIRFSFTVPEQNLSLQPITSFYTQDLNLTADSSNPDILYSTLELLPFSYAQVSLNQTGEIISWDLAAFAKEAITPETNLEEHARTDESVNVRSNSASGDLLTHRFHPSTWHGHWIQLALLEFNYEDEASLNNWTLERIRVPEPGLAGLSLSGVAILFWRRRAHKNTIR